MIREWLAWGLVVGAFVAATGLGIEAVCRATGRASRWVWALALGAMLVLVVAAPLRQRRADAVTLTGVVRVVQLPSAPARAGGLLALVTRVRTLAARPFDDAMLVAARLPRETDRWLVIAWIAAAALLFGILVVAWLRWRAASRRWPTADVHGVRVRVAPDTGPAAVGIIEPEIVVPHWLLAVTPEQQRLAVAHEQEHLRARDPLLLVAGLATVVLLPWNPAVWWMLSRLRLCVELDCDARVLRGRRADAAIYGSVLIDLAERCSAARLGAPALADGTRHLHRRILAMTSHPSRLALLRATAVVVVALGGLMTACEAHLPTSAEVERMDARGAERQVASTGTLDSVSTYLVDGAPVTRAQALAIPSSEIASILIRHRTSDEPAECAKRDGGTESCVASAMAAGSVMSIRTRARSDTGMVKVEGRDGMTRDTFGGLIYIDGVRADMAALRSLTPHDIVSVQVLKGEAAMKAYSAPEAAHGVIRITTVHAAAR